MKLGLFTDTLEDINGVARFIRDMGEQARHTEHEFVIHTCAARTTLTNAEFARKNFRPLVSTALPYYPQQAIALPPFSTMLSWAKKQKFDMIHLSTPGPVGLCGWLIARWLRIPFAATYHTDFPAYVDRLSGSRIVTGGTSVFMKWFYRPATLVFARSREYHEILIKLGIAPNRLRTIRPAINLRRFNADYRNPDIWQRFGVTEPLRLLYIGRVSVEKNLQTLVDAFKLISARRRDVALVVAGDGPFREPMKSMLAGTPSYVLGVQTDQTLAELYCAADLFAFPSRTDTLGQVVMESQACGLPALVSDEGGPKTIVQHGETGRVVQGIDPHHWAAEIERLLDDRQTRTQMGLAAAARLKQFSLADTFADFWAQHAQVVERRHHRAAKRESGVDLSTHVSNNAVAL
ncbi:MAG TPA: glycosyltransferase [Tepidisphaeraceae bacterium]|nr:glycosyltransferase [Tepidisphaeraceae bacterium]